MISLVRTLPVIWQLAIGVGLVAGVGIAYAAWRHHVYQSGYDDALLGVAADNKEAIDARNKAVRRVWDCRAAGRVWDVTAGVCR